jgi:hypothetical protein
MHQSTIIDNWLIILPVELYPAKTIKDSCILNYTIMPWPCGPVRGWEVDSGERLGYVLCNNYFILTHLLSDFS